MRGSPQVWSVVHSESVENAIADAPAAVIALDEREPVTRCGDGLSGMRSGQRHLVVIRKPTRMRPKPMRMLPTPRSGMGNALRLT